MVQNVDLILAWQAKREQLLYHSFWAEIKGMVQDCFNHFLIPDSSQQVVVVLGEDIKTGSCAGESSCPANQKDFLGS